MNPGRPTALLRSDRFRSHQTGSHPENAGRLVAIDRAIGQADLASGRPEVPFVPASTAAITRIHDPRYVDALHRFAAEGGGMIGGDTVVGPESWDVAALAAGAAIALVDAALDGQATRGFALSRPPGHHATPSTGMGFCPLNNVAIAAAHALSRDVPRVAIVDWDVHHGNGTQDAFYEDDRVFFCSIHQWPLYPMTGRSEERGRGDGFGTTLNLPQPPGRGDDEYLAIFDDRVAPAVRSFDPDLVLLSAGFDAHGADPLGGMNLSAAGFGALTERLATLADDLCDGRLVAVLEGGYDPPATAASVVATLCALDGIAAPDWLAELGD